jgi:molybdate transport system substrate-binding protein
MALKGKLRPRGTFVLFSTLAMFLMALPLHANAQTVRGLVTIGMQRVFEDIKPAFEAAAGQSIDVDFASTPDITKWIESGERADFVIASRAGLDALVKARKITPDQFVILGGSLITVAVPAGHPKPDISTADRLKAALLAARAISFTDPASGGPSGIQFENILQHLDIVQQIRCTTRFPPFGGRVGDILARGDADIGIQQATELSGFPGVDVVGPLPREFQVVTEYAIGVPVGAADPTASRSLIDFMCSPGGAHLMKAKGLDPQ